MCEISKESMKQIEKICFDAAARSKEGLDIESGDDEKEWNLQEAFIH